MSFLTAAAFLSVGCAQVDPANVVDTGHEEVTAVSSTEPQLDQPTSSSPLPSNNTQALGSVGRETAANRNYLAWYSSQMTDSAHAVTYLVHATDDLGDVYDETARGFVVDVPFGMSPGDGRLQVWSRDHSHGASHPAQRVVWPASCLGPSPDIDGDGLLDPCDPYPSDGPIADFDGDGVRNLDDNCPTLPNPDQAVTGGRFSGAVCDPRTDAHASAWLVPALVTLESWNEQRGGQGLDPIVMPDAEITLPADVHAWCDTLAEREAVDEWAIVAMLDELPAAYGLSDQDTERLQELLTEAQIMSEAFTGVENAETEEAFNDLLVRIQPYLVVFFDSDLACGDW